MSALSTPTARLSFGLTAFTVSLGLVAYFLGLMPNEERSTMEARASIVEALTIPLAAALEKNDAEAMKNVIDAVVARHGMLSAISVFGPNGAVLAESREGSLTHSGEERIHITLASGDAPQGNIEFVFRVEDGGWTLWGIPAKTIALFGFVIVVCYTGFYFYLRRALRILNPEGTVPDRVASAFNTLAEGVLIVDIEGYILLANRGFTNSIQWIDAPLVGMKIDELPWIVPEHDVPENLPWRVALTHARSVVGYAMAIQVSEGDARRLVVNATRIEDETGALQGAIVTFDDVTNLHNLNEELYHSIEQLRSFQSTIETQNRQLALLATRDPLTDCLNRRAFFAEFETALIESANQSKSAALMMIDVDHFKSVNDRFGHAVGDKVLINLVETLNAVCNENDLVGRYGGEEFCIVARGRNDEETEAFANEVCLRVAAAESWLPNGQPVTISIGLVACRDVGVNTKDCAKRGDEALYAAKVSGRNRVVNWRTIAAALPANSEFLEELVKSKVRS